MNDWIYITTGGEQNMAGGEKIVPHAGKDSLDFRYV